MKDGDTTRTLETILEEVLGSFTSIDVDEIPRIDLYMDQVLTFLQENLSSTARNPGEDRVLTKAMINNYVKNKVLIPPVRKKYGRDHILLLVLIYYLKNFLSIEDIRQIIAPISARYAQPSVSPAGGHGQEERRGARLTVPEIYTKVFEDAGRQKADVREKVERMIETARDSFAQEGLSQREQELLSRFDLICQLSADIYVRKLYIEKIVDSYKQ